MTNQPKKELPPIESKIEGIYRHYKGNLYRVLGVGRHSETLEEMVIYESLSYPGELWVRPARMWNETVTVNGVSQNRFSRIDQAE